MAVQEGREDEDHLAAAAWNVQALMVTLEWCRAGRLPISLVDLPYQLHEDDGAVTYPIVPQQDPIQAALARALAGSDNRTSES